MPDGSAFTNWATVLGQSQTSEFKKLEFFSYNYILIIFFPLPQNVLKKEQGE